MYGIGGFKLCTGYTNRSLFGLHALLKLSMQRLTTFDKSVPLLYTYNTIWQKKSACNIFPCFTSFKKQVKLRLTKTSRGKKGN